MEGTGSYGTGLPRYLAACGVEATGVIRPNRQARRQRGKSDTADAVAALAALNGDPADAASVLIRGWIHSADPLAGTAAKGSGPG